MNIILIRTANGIAYAKKIQRHISACGVRCRVIDIDSLLPMIKRYKLQPSSTLIHSRTAGLETNQKIADIEKLGFTVVNPSNVLTLTNNKYLAQVHARDKKLPAAKTYKVKKENIRRILSLLREHKTLVLKPIYSQGQGIYCEKISSNIKKDKLKKLLNAMPGRNIQVQQFINYKKLIRVIVINYHALKNATAYDEPKKNWKCSVCLNPEIKKFKIGSSSNALFKLAEKTARTFGAKINFIDFFEDRSGKYYLNEINTACNLSIHEKITAVPIHKYIGDFLIKELRRRAAVTA